MGKLFQFVVVFCAVSQCFGAMSPKLDSNPADFNIALPVSLDSDYTSNNVITISQVGFSSGTALPASFETNPVLSEVVLSIPKSKPSGQDANALPAPGKNSFWSARSLFMLQGSIN
jgi:hypothetical protein